MVWLFSDLQLVQSLHVESFFEASMMLEFHELCDGLMTPVFNITSIFFFISSNIPWGIHLTFSLICVSSSNGILCVTNVVWPRSLSLWENKSGYWANKFSNCFLCSLSNLVIALNFLVRSFSSLFWVKHIVVWYWTLCASIMVRMGLCENRTSSAWIVTGQSLMLITGNDIFQVRNYSLKW